jgi:3-hydroxyacyl-CoA dehydrogenase/enoyl-CoA hydratase/3-hydroxybutyryl-CoA epimerase
VHQHVIDQLNQIVKPAKHRATEKDIIDRCVLLQVNEAAYELSDGIVATPADLDLAMVTGTGFAPFRGGLLAYADARGLPEIVRTLKLLQKKYNSDRFQPAPLLVEMATSGKRFFEDRPDPKLLKNVPQLPYSKLQSRL